MSVAAEASSGLRQFAERPLWQRAALIGALGASALIVNTVNQCNPVPLKTLEQAPVEAVVSASGPAASIV